MRDIDEAVARSREVEDEVLGRPDVLRMGVGYRERGGTTTDEVVIRVYVEKKLPLDELPEERRIPAEVNGVPTDVIEARPVTLADVKGFKERPVPCGLEISLVGANTDLYSGTSGCFVNKNGSDGVYLLTAAHVLRNLHHQMMDGIVYQAVPVGWINRVALTTDSIFGGTVDAGVAKMDSDVGHTNYVWKIGNLTGSADPVLGSAVKKHGRTTDYTAGTVSAVNLTMELEGKTFRDLIEVRPDAAYPTFCDEGDSGSPLVNGPNQIIGIVMATDRYYGYACRIDHVFDELGVTLAALPGE
ncbi:trypsin-like serine protease [Agromyces lapidis]|uniref:Trypsin-like serine protease n=1 Tax=Agromyces lapidis TaxID=279574 RepID=A0ABV5SSA7_9MICO|nr:trypsin-like serine protease [Agromyces lapidis]